MNIIHSITPLSLSIHFPYHILHRVTGNLKPNPGNPGNKVWDTASRVFLNMVQFGVKTTTLATLSLTLHSTRDRDFLQKLIPDLRPGKADKKAPTQLGIPSPELGTVQEVTSNQHACSRISSYLYISYIVGTIIDFKSIYIQMYSFVKCITRTIQSAVLRWNINIPHYS